MRRVTRRTVKRLSDKLLGFDGGKDFLKLFKGDRSGVSAFRVEAIKHVLIAAAKDLGEIVAIVPTEFLYSFDNVKDTFHRVTEAGEVFLSADDAKLDASLGKMACVEAVAV